MGRARALADILNTPDKAEYFSVLTKNGKEVRIRPKGLYTETSCKFTKQDALVFNKNGNDIEYKLKTVDVANIKLPELFKSYTKTSITSTLKEDGYRYLLISNKGMFGASAIEQYLVDFKLQAGIIKESGVFKADNQGILHSVANKDFHVGQPISVLLTLLKNATGSFQVIENYADTPLLKTGMDIKNIKVFFASGLIRGEKPYITLPENCNTFAHYKGENIEGFIYAKELAGYSWGRAYYPEMKGQYPRLKDLMFYNMNTNKASKITTDKNIYTINQFLKYKTHMPFTTDGDAFITVNSSSDSIMVYTIKEQKDGVFLAFKKSCAFPFQVSGSFYMITSPNTYGNILCATQNYRRASKKYYMNYKTNNSSSGNYLFGGKSNDVDSSYIPRNHKDHACIQAMYINNILLGNWNGLSRLSSNLTGYSAVSISGLSSSFTNYSSTTNTSISATTYKDSIWIKRNANRDIFLLKTSNSWISASKVNVPSLYKAFSKKDQFFKELGYKS